MVNHLLDDLVRQVHSYEKITRGQYDGTVAPLKYLAYEVEGSSINQNKHLCMLDSVLIV